MNNLQNPRHHGNYRPYIQIRSTLIGQQLSILKNQKVTACYLTYKKNTEKKLEWGGALRAALPPRSSRVKHIRFIDKSSTQCFFA